MDSSQPAGMEPEMIPQQYSVSLRGFLRAFLCALTLMTVAPANAAYMAPVSVDGREWLQPVDFLNTSWNDVAGVCDPISGACDGSLNGGSLSGWTWASIQDVSYLFDFFRDNYGSGQSAASAVFINADFERTFQVSSAGEAFLYLSGVTRSMDGTDRAYYGEVLWGVSFEYDLSYLSAPGGSIFTSSPSDFYGHFFYRGPAFSVPAPASGALVAVGLACLIRIRQR